MARLVILLSFCLLVAFPEFTPAAEGNLKAIRGPIEMNYGASPRMYVVFNHNTHKDVKCRICHHIATDKGKRFVNCTIEECHSVAGARQRDPLSMFMAYHARGTDRSCYGCHKMEAASHPEFKGCRPCHMSPMARQEVAEKTPVQAAK